MSDFRVVIPLVHLALTSARSLAWLDSTRRNGSLTEYRNVSSDTIVVTGRQPDVVVGGFVALARGELDAYVEQIDGSVP